MATKRPTNDPLAPYRRKRDFGKSPEPRGELPSAGITHGGRQLTYVIQKHAATRLHYDLRLELDGVMLSWAVPKGPSYDPKEKRMAVQTEDHPISYNSFEGTIPRGQYGAGNVIIWDRGTWEPVNDPRAGLKDGKLVFKLNGQKLAGLWELVRIGKPDDRQPAWFLFKKHDQYERSMADYDVVKALPDSVVAKPLPPASRSAEPTRRRGQKAAARASDLPGAAKSELPPKLAPQLATFSAGVPTSGEWSFEIKFDGYRVMARIDAQGSPRLITRGGHDWSAKMAALVTELERLGLASSWLDGEVVVLGANGVPDFNALQNAFDHRASDQITYFVFDLPFHDGYDLRKVPLAQRRAFLRALLERHPSERVRFSADFETDAPSMLQSARRLGLEGIIAKRADAPYVSARTETWLKLKCRQRQEFVIVGFADRGNERSAAEIGSLQLAVYDEAEKKLVAVGSVGTGWNANTAADLKARLRKLETAKPAALKTNEAGNPRKGRWSKRDIGTIRWVKPELVAEVSFAEWTPEGQIRHATFVGLRDDKAPTDVRRETAATPPGAIPLNSTGTTTKVSHPERVVDPSTGLTKLDVVRYYESVAEWMLPHLVGRPCSLVRAPNGITGQLFFQKHDEARTIPGLRRLDRALWPEHEALLEVPAAPAIGEAAQMNVLEFHTWNATVRNIGKPDRMVFDLDPGDGVAWKAVQEGALLVRSLLQELSLESWLKTSGGKGLHVVVPLMPRDDWDSVKELSRALVQHLVRVIPGRFVAVSGERNRVGRIFVDFLRNSHGATTAAAFSVRARRGLGVSMPVSWDDLGSLKSGAHWTVATAREHLSFQTVDPWAGYWKSRQTTTRARKLLARP
ncbi:MAG TPA: DNA ligase D [Burkholderiaceae bacterium]|nr:DNA ligase D [Burkholderiaceae bacterium]